MTKERLSRVRKTQEKRHPSRNVSLKQYRNYTSSQDLKAHSHHPYIQFPVHRQVMPIQRFPISPPHPHLATLPPLANGSTPSSALAPTQQHPPPSPKRRRSLTISKTAWNRYSFATTTTFLHFSVLQAGRLSKQTCTRSKPQTISPSTSHRPGEVSWTYGTGSFGVWLPVRAVRYLQRSLLNMQNGIC